MRVLAILSSFLFLILSTSSFAQVDIYQSDAYSVEEMCAREAEQNDAADYSSAYENCIKKNQDNPMYHADAGSTDPHSQGSDDSSGDAMESEP
ncbi:hypothetical protein [Marinimicrobium agarilyticum]|uniref:hypothetical protein n=1 Tax=Marinimicrobium agarilyticum TaxID=306546 RepID=UPI0003FEDA65|nr:hypothetical protein [Marinimicrobium agarilyticum]